MKRTLVCVLAALLAPVPAVAAGGEDPESTVKQILGSVVSSAPVGYHQRFESVLGPVTLHHDVKGFVRAALGERWADLPEGEREGLERLMPRLLADFYARKIGERAGSSFTVQGWDALDETIFAHATLHRTGSRDRALEFRFGRLRVVDVSIDGKSYRQTCREDWRALQAFGYVLGLRDALERRLPGKNESATACVERLQSALLLAMQKADRLGYLGRHVLLSPVVESTHDLSVIALTTIRRDWKGLSTEQKREFLEVFRMLSLSTYAARFNGHSGESFKVVATEDLPRDTKQVKTVIVRPGKESVRLDYVLRQRDGRWLIVNILADGVSDLALKRAEYRSVVERDGFPGLVKKLRAQISRHQAGAEK